MIKTTIFLITLFCFSITFSQSINQKVKDSKGNVKLLGEIDKEGLTQAPFNEWFSKNHANYLGNDKILERLKGSIKDCEIIVFLGTWCGDSKREVPRFYNILEATNFPIEQLKLIAVDNEAKTYKQSPTSEEKGLNIHRVPTFIFYKNGKEINRIVESPVETLERDIYSILSTNSYQPNYEAVSLLENLMKRNGLEKLRNQEPENLSRLAEIISSCYEINTYAYVKLRAQLFDEALYLFDLNSKLFSYKDYTHLSLGNGYYQIKDYNKALYSYNKALNLNKKNDRAKKMIQKIKSEMKQ